MFRYTKQLYKFLSCGQITTTQHQPATYINGKKSRQIRTHRIALTTGGFIEIVEDYIPNTSYIHIQLGQPKHPHELTETYKYVRYGTDKETVWLLREQRTALKELVDTLCQ
jgi:hypothetical protein